MFPDEPALFLWGVFAIITVGALLPIRIDNRQDHIVLTIAATVAAAIFGLPALGMLWASVAVAIVVMALARGVLVALGRGASHVLHDVPRSAGWVVLSAFATTIGFVLANFFYATVFGRSYPVTLASTTDFTEGAVVVFVWWTGTMAVRVVYLRRVGGSLFQKSLDPFDSVFVPYLLPIMGGFPLIVASVALYRPSDPWPSLLILWWCFPLYAATALDLHRRRLAQELRRDVFATQRLAAIGEVSARIVHQSRHQVGLMGWSIHRLRGLVGQDDPAQVRAAQAELDALAGAKDRLSTMLTAELLHEVPPADGDAGDAVATTTLAEVVAHVREQLQAEADREGVALQVDLAPGPAGRPVGRELQDVVFNLVDNAIDAARTQVHVGVAHEEGADVVVVRDDGPGLSGPDLERAFEPFFTTKGDGTGMGLAIADALVGDLGGDLRVERRGGETAFVVTLPEHVAR